MVSLRQLCFCLTNRVTARVLSNFVDFFSRCSFIVFQVLFSSLGHINVVSTIRFNDTIVENNFKNLNHCPFFFVILRTYT